MFSRFLTINILENIKNSFILKETFLKRKYFDSPRPKCFIPPRNILLPCAKSMLLTFHYNNLNESDSSIFFYILQRISYAHRIFIRDHNNI